MNTGTLIGGVRDAQTAWAAQVAEIKALFAAVVGQAVTVTGPQWGQGRQKVETRAGWVDAVTPHGWVFAQTVPGAWGQESPGVVRTFLSWADLWAEDHRTTVQGAWGIPTDLGPLALDVGAWMSDWVARGRSAFASSAAGPGTARLVTALGGEEDDRFSANAAAGRPGGFDRSARGVASARVAMGGSVPVS